MKIVKGNKNVEYTKNEVETLVKGFETVVIDLGCGDGRFVYKNAIKNPTSLFIGVDPAPKQMEEFSKKVVRKKLLNCIFAIGALDNLPQELYMRADKLYILLPWGSLLSAIAKPSIDSIKQINFVLKTKAEIEIVFGYAPELEPNQTTRLALDEVTMDSFEKEAAPLFETIGFKIVEQKVLSSAELKNLESTWGKRIFTRDTRQILRIIFKRL